MIRRRAFVEFVVGSPFEDATKAFTFRPRGILGVRHTPTDWKPLEGLPRVGRGEDAPQRRGDISWSRDPQGRAVVRLWSPNLPSAGQAHD
jgi:hypothetical protein